MMLPGFTAERALVRRNTAWCGTARGVLDAAAVRIAYLPGGKYWCGPCPPGTGPGLGGYYWCCWSNPWMNGYQCRSYSCDPCAGIVKRCAREFCICDNTPTAFWEPDPSELCGGSCVFG
jgi:hypothetical protein